MARGRPETLQKCCMDEFSSGSLVDLNFAAFSATSSEMFPSKMAEAITVITTAMVDKVPTALRYDKRRGVRRIIVGRIAIADTKSMFVLTAILGNNVFKWSPILIRKMQRQEKSSKYKTIERKMHPASPKEARAMSGNDLTGGLMRALAEDPGGNGVLNGESSKKLAGLGSPFISLPIKMDVLHVIAPRLIRQKIPPPQPALFSANGKPRRPTPCPKENSRLKNHFPFT